MLTIKSLKQTGFTIVELLIVIVVISILAGIAILGYSGVQADARDAARNTAVAQIRKSLEVYRTTHSTYPSYVAIGTNAPAGFSGVWGSNYSYSVATNGSWMRPLIQSGVVSSVPVDPTNDNSHYFAYWSSPGYGACKEPFYVLTVVGYEDSQKIPNDSRTLDCTEGSSIAYWNVSHNTGRAIFSNLKTPGT